MTLLLSWAQSTPGITRDCARIVAGRLPRLHRFVYVDIEVGMLWHVVHRSASGALVDQADQAHLMRTGLYKLMCASAVASSNPVLCRRVYWHKKE